MTVERKYLLITITISLLLSFLHCPWFEIFSDDKEIFKYTGFVIYRGGVPYRDFFDHKPPLIYFINYLGILAGGTWGLWLIDTALVLFTTIMFSRVCLKFSLLFPWLLPMLFNIMIRDKRVSTGVGMTREYTAILILLFICVMLSNKKYKYLIMGLLSGLVFFMQQDQIFVLCPFWLYAVFFNNTDKLVFARRLTQLAAGFLIVSALVIGYFAYHHSLQHFWEDSFLFNFNWYSEKYPLIENLKGIHNYLHETNFEMLFYIAVILGTGSLIWGNKYRILLIASLAAVVFSFSPAIISGKFVSGGGFYYYLLPLATTIPFLLFLIFAGNTQFRFDKKMMWMLGAMLYVAPIYGVIQYTLHLPERPTAFEKKPFEYRYLSRKQLKDYDLYVVFDANDIYLYNEFKILAPSKWIYHFFWTWFDGWDADLKIIHSITDDLKSHKTRYILEYSDGYFQFNDKRVYDYWNSFLNEYYVQEETTQPIRDGGKLWRLK